MRYKPRHNPVGEPAQERHRMLYKLYDARTLFHVNEQAAELPISDAREHLAEVIGRARYSGEDTILTHYGRPAAVVISFEKYQQLKGAEVLQLPPEIESVIEDGRRHPERRKPRPRRAERRRATE